MAYWLQHHDLAAAEAMLSRMTLHRVRPDDTIVVALLNVYLSSQDQTVLSGRGPGIVAALRVVVCTSGFVS